MPDRLYFTDSDEANALIATDPMALLIGFALDQQVTVQKAFMGPLVLRERLGAIDAATLAEADLEPVFRERPAIHRYPGNMARRVHDLAVYVRDRYDGDAARVWTDAADGDELRANVAGLPGFGEMKIKSLGSVLYHHFGVEAARDLVPWHPTLGNVDSAAALAEYQATKRQHKAEWAKAQAKASRPDLELALDVVDELLVQIEEPAQEAVDEVQVLLAVWQAGSPAVARVHPLAQVGDLGAQGLQAGARHLLPHQVGDEQAQERVALERRDGDRRPRVGAQRSQPLVGERVDGALAGLARLLARVQVTEAGQPLRFGVVLALARPGQHATALGQAQQVVGARALAADEAEDLVREEGQVSCA